MSEEPDYVPLSEFDRVPRRRCHSPFIINGRPADLQPLPTIDPLKWDRQEVPERRWIVPGIIPEGNVTMLNGDGGLGKSQLALQLLASTVLGKPWLGIDVRRCKAVGLFCEDDHDELHRRLATIIEHYDASFADLEDLKLVCRVDQENLLLEFRDQWQAGETTALYQRLQSLVTAHGAELLVVDSLHDLFGGNENSRQHARQFIGSLRSIALGMETGAVLVTAHPSLSGRNTGTGEAGSTAWNNAVRSRLYLTAPQREDDEADRDDYRELKTMKANYAARGGSIRLRWRDGIFERDEAKQPPANLVDKIDLDNQLLNEMRRMIDEGAELPSDPAARNAFVNAVRKREGFRQLGQGTALAAQRRLVEASRAEIVRMGPPSKSRAYIRPAGVAYAREQKPDA